MTPKNKLIQSLQSIKNAIVNAKELADVASPYDHAIKMVNDLIIKTENDQIAYPINQTLSNSDRFVSDSLPWTGDILETIQGEYRILRQLGIIAKSSH
jgi:hypothetical protein